MRRCKARAASPGPIAIAPPCQIPSAMIRSTVIAVPHKTTSPGRSWGISRTAADTAKARSAPAVSGRSSECRTGTSTADRASGRKRPHLRLRNCSRQAASGGLTVEIVQDDNANLPRPHCFQTASHRFWCVEPQCDRRDQPAGFIQPAPLEPRISRSATTRITT